VQGVVGNDDKPAAMKISGTAAAAFTPHVRALMARPKELG
jgi:hypothetical protein